ncbi:Crp/Fnr family transcriptional regulator [Catellatospora sp. TT07R-123]|uniref:Crp/Fnr family transcriptional regulator n=1 Tax=Catellatospora sp. TT07R-123 TaxID=2733863 RepID=UPI001B2124F2|nr:Crp/Fnr family transcriptional regulator [Catellatospora sp. TT07R-123]GHJ43465.1 Crp/Fnr family transcriptional regulator [Catellatospora sp. TT07R-123]
MAERRVGGLSWPVGSFLGRLPEHDRQVLLCSGGMREYDPGACLVLQGQPGIDVIALLSGCAKVVGVTADGDETIVDIRTTGDLVGEMANMDGGVRSSTVVAVRRVLGVVIAGQRFQELLGRHPAVAAALSATMAKKLRTATRLHVDLLHGPVIARLARLLIHLAELHGLPGDGGRLIDVPLSQRDLASLVGTTEPSVYRALTELRRRGAVSTRRRFVCVRDPGSLALAAAITDGRARG